MGSCGALAYFLVEAFSLFCLVSIPRLERSEEAGTWKGAISWETWHNKGHCGSLTNDPRGEVLFPFHPSETPDALGFVSNHNDFLLPEGAKLCRLLKVLSD